MEKIDVEVFKKLLSSRGSSYPFTLILDSVDQSAAPLLRYFTHNNASKSEVIFLSYETLKRPANVIFVKARGKDPSEIHKEVGKHVSKSKRTLIIIDSLYALSTYVDPPFSLATFLSSFPSPTTSLLAIYHTDVPLPGPAPSPYAPSPLTILRFLATTILTTHNFSQILARKPLFGEEPGGVPLFSSSKDGENTKGCVVEMEYRRQSGRSVEQWFYLPELGSSEHLMLLEHQELFRRRWGDGDSREGEDWRDLTTFDLELTAKQKRDREEVVLPYHDAQKGEGGTGGRILYDMGVEDDFDDEEDEV